jgi:hypothetical protein
MKEEFSTSKEAKLIADIVLKSINTEGWDYTIRSFGQKDVDYRSGSNIPELYFTVKFINKKFKLQIESYNFCGNEYFICSPLCAENDDFYSIHNGLENDNVYDKDPNVALEKYIHSCQDYINEINEVFALSISILKTTKK